MRFLALGVAVALLGACATGRAVRSGDVAARKGDWDSAVAYYREALGRDPGRIDVRISLERAMREAAAEHIRRARDLEAQDQLTGAAAEYRLAADLEPSNTLALTKAIEIEKKIRDTIEASRPKSRMDELREQAAQQTTFPTLDPRTRVPFMHFPGVALRDILKNIGDFGGINITYDSSANALLSQPYTLDIQDTSLEDALNQVLTANQLTYKIINSKTILVYQDSPSNRQKFEDQYTQTFYLSHADAQEMMQILTQLTGTAVVRPIVTPNKTSNTLVVKATRPVLEVIQGVINANDKPRAEVLVDVEILEVDRTRIKQLGLDLSQYALGFTFSPEVAPPNTATTPNAFPAQPPPFNLNTISKGVSPADYYLTSPTALIRALESDTSTKLLAKPQLRGREGATLTLQLGDDIPVPTTSFLPTAAGGVPTQPQVSYTYRSIGVNLTITPRVTYQDEIILDPITVDKSGVGPNVDVAGQSLPSFVKRTATVSMRLRDGESNLLAGLIREEDRKTLKSLPGIARLPGLRLLFGNVDQSNDTTDIVMVVTPHIVRSREVTAEDLKPIYVGTGTNFGARTQPQLISPNAPPPPATVPPGGGLPAQGAGVPPTTPPAGNPAGAAGQTRIPGVVAVPPPVPPPPAAPPEAQAPQLLVTAPDQTLSPGGGPYTVPIQIAGVSQVGAVSMTITYDPAVLKAVSVSQGSFMQQGGVTTSFTPRIDEAAGRIDVAIGRASSQPGASGTGMLVGLVFQAVAPGSSSIGLSGVVIGSDGQPIAVQVVPASVVVK